MALDIQTGYSAEFKTFVEFAQKAHDDGFTSATAKATLSSRVFTVTNANASNVGWFSRTSGDEAANDVTRARFKAAVIEMFGGESKLPEAVKQAMIMDDYGKGRPLSTRRILSVRDAIEANADQLVVKRGGAQLKIEDSFQSPEVRAAALGMGFTEAELSKIARATRLYLQCEDAPRSEMEAMREVATLGTKANRLAFYGGRFLVNAENFKAGLKLLDSFKTWFDDVRAYGQADKGKLENADTPSKLNATTTLYGNEKNVKGLEALVFQDIATDPNFDLNKAGEAAFGFENNAVIRFCGRGGHKSMFGTVLNVPPERRRILFAAMDAFLPVAKTKDEALRMNHDPALGTIRDTRVFVSRVINHLAELSNLMDKGELTTKNIIKTCFPDIKKPGNYDLKALNVWLYDTITNTLEAQHLDDGADISIMNKMVDSGCTLEEAIKSYRDGTPLSVGAYHAGYSFDISAFPEGGLSQMKADLVRGTNYGRVDAEGRVHADDVLVPDAANHKTVKFPDGTVLACSGKDGEKTNPETVESKVRQLCGEAHALQANIVGYCLSQSANGPLNHALTQYGIHASEHGILNYTLSKDADTGAIAIRYSSPDLPVNFSWTCTVNTDGTCITTPMVVVDDMKPVVMTRDTALGLVNDSANLFGESANFDAETANTAANYLVKHGNGLPARKARILSNYIVNNLLRNDEGINEDSLEILVRDMKKWQLFGFEDKRLTALGRKVAQRQNDYLKVTADKADMYAAEDPNIFKQFVTDIPRGEFVINGTRFKPGSDPKKVIEAFTDAVRKPKSQKALSTLFNQGGFDDVQSLCTKSPSPVHGNPEKEEQLNEIKGGELFVSKDVNTDLTTLVSDGDMRYELEVDERGRNATITLTINKNLTANGQGDPNHFIGTAMITQRTTIDLTKETPLVTDVTFSQIFSPQPPV